VRQLRQCVRNHYPATVYLLTQTDALTQVLTQPKNLRQYKNHLYDCIPDALTQLTQKTRTF
jgi:hypothetical protein